MAAATHSVQAAPAAGSGRSGGGALVSVSLLLRPRAARRLVGALGAQPRLVLRSPAQSGSSSGDTWQRALVVEVSHVTAAREWLGMVLLACKQQQQQQQQHGIRAC